MSFLNPLFLMALFAVLLPLVIHLLNLKKPKRIQFSTLAFFKELQKSTIRKIKIKRYLLLLLRLLAVACLAIVLARPFLPPIFGFGGNSKQPAIIALLVDNSISMARVGAKGPLIEQVKTIVDDIVSASGGEDRFLLQVTNGAEFTTSVLSKSQVASRLEQLDVNASGNYATPRLLQLTQAVNESQFQNKKIFIISDGQIQTDEALGAAVKEIPETISTTFVKLENVAVQNTYIENVSSPTSMVGKGTPYQLQAQVTNGGNVLAANQFLSLQVEGTTLGQYPIELTPGETQSFSFTLIPEKTGSLNGELIIEGDDFTHDNNYFFSIEVPDKRQILLVREDASAMQSFSFTQLVLDAPEQADAQLQYKRIDAAELANTQLNEYDAIILEGINRIPEYAFDRIQEFVQSGKGVMLFPSQNADINNYNEFLSLFNAGKIGGIVGDYGSTKMVATGDEILQDHPIFTGLFEQGDDEQLLFATPDIYYYYKLEAPSVGSGLNLITLNSKDPLVREKQFGQGKIIISAIGNGPDWSNFPVKALYAPFYYRSILYAASSQSGGFVAHTLGNKFVWEGDLNASSTKITANAQEITVVPQNLGGRIKIEYPAQEWESGWVEVSDGEKSYSIAANLPSNESNFLDQGSLDTLLASTANANFVDASTMDAQQLSESIKSSGFGKEVWLWFMLAGILLLIIESLVSIYFKAETIT
ncbi:MAG: BatA domain-containing protein [Balneolaceae bacterium]